MKTVVLDMDETLGAFASFAKYVSVVAPFAVTSTLFGHLLDRNQQYLRPGILEILQFLKANRGFNRCKVVLYTNNQNPHWVRLVKYYLETKMGPLFDHVIQAYGVEKKRTRQGKCLVDMLACTHFDVKDAVFFVDDQHHPGMVADNVEYFHIKPYAEPCAFDVDPSRELLRRLTAFLQISPPCGEKSPECPPRSSAASKWCTPAEARAQTAAAAGKRTFHPAPAAALR